MGNLILICAGAIPGYWVTVATVDRLGRKPIQITGFVILTIIFIVIGFAYEPLKKSDHGLLALYVVAQFFFNFGPNATTFIVPGNASLRGIGQLHMVSVPPLERSGPSLRSVYLGR